MPGQPKALDASKQDTVCNLVAAGVSLRRAARYVECDPKSVRREAARNDDFRCRLEKAKSSASIRPLQTLLEAAQEDWRAALSWMERVDPDRFVRPDASIITKREANKLVDDLIAAIEKAIKKPQQRNRLLRLLTPVMPIAMRHKWEIISRRRAAEDYDRVQAERANKRSLARKARDDRRTRLWREIADWLPWKLFDKLLKNEDLFDPEEVFDQKPGDNRTPNELIKDAFADVPRHYKPGSIKSTEYVALNRAERKSYSSNEWSALTQEERERVSAEYHNETRALEAVLWPAAQSPQDSSPKGASQIAEAPDGATKGASLATKDAVPVASNSPPPRRLSDNNASPPDANPNPPNNLPTSGEAPAGE